MISLSVPVDKIHFVRSIEGRKFRDGKWIFPESALETLIKYGLLGNEYELKEKEYVQYDLSDFLYKHQKEAVNKALNEDGYGLFLDTGCGKTLCGIEIAKHLGKTLVLCPLSIIETAWIDDCKKFYPELKIVNCWSNSKQKRIDALNTDADIYVMNYESFKILKNKIRKKDFKCMIVDESSVMKNMKSQITTDILSCVEFIPRRYILSGCPTPNHNLEIFPQIKFCNSDMFGNNYLGFQASYFHQDLENPHVWYQTQDDKDRFFRKLSKGSVFVNKEDCVELPDKIFAIKEFDLDKEQRKYYNDILNDIKEHINEWSKFEFTAKLMKLREVVSEFVIQKDGSASDFKTSKDNVLEDTLSEIGNKQVIVWCQFIHEIERLAKQFDGMALTSKTKNRDDIIRKFKNGDIELLFTHPKLLGKGVTFTNCTYNIYYSLSFSYEEFKQSQDRIHRIGQKNKCTYIILQGKNTIDQKIYRCLQHKENAVDELFLEMGLKS